MAVNWPTRRFDPRRISFAPRFGPRQNETGAETWCSRKKTIEIQQEKKKNRQKTYEKN